MSHSGGFIFHLLPNAHLDPVWFWDWREGLNEGLTTVRTVLNLMEDFPDLTFIRGESAIYEHIRKTDRALFRRILKRIDEGRWDVVGGTVIQPDTNLPSTEVLCREFERGLAYCEERLGVRPRVAWLADSFGHSAGFPNVLSAFGMEGFAFTRPQRAQFPMEEAAFWWEAGARARVLCYRQHWLWYCNERDNIAESLDVTLAGARRQSLHHVGLLCGMGNHGGGPTRRHLHDVEVWKARNPEVEVRFSTLHGFFRALNEEIATTPGLTIPAFRGEFGHCLRGCYSSVQKFKGLYRRGEARIAAADMTRSVIGAATGRRLPGPDAAWDALAFNAFHDVLPGSSIERAMEEQAEWMGGALYEAAAVQFAALNRLAAKVDTTVPPPRRADLPTDVPLLVWNPLPRPFKGLVELEASLDYRPIYAFQNRTLPVVVHDHAGNAAPLQVIDTEHSSMPDLPWRRRVVTPVEVPALGWTVARLGWRDEPAEAPQAGARCTADRGPLPKIANADWTLEVRPGTLAIRYRGADFFAEGRNLELRVVEDPWGSWGGMHEEEEAIRLERLREVWRLEHAEVLEPGPLRAKLWTRWQGGRSWIDLTFAVDAFSDCLAVDGRLLWNERSARLKLALPCRGGLEFEVPGGRVKRPAGQGQVPAGRWAVRAGTEGTMGVASDVLGDFDATEDELRLTLARASRFANDVKTAPEEKMWQPATDCGEMKFRLLFFGAETNPDDAADALRFPPVALTTVPAKGPWARQGSLTAVEPASLRLLAMDHLDAGRLRVRLQNGGEASAAAVLRMGGTALALGGMEPGEIRNFLLEKEGRCWRLAGERHGGGNGTALPRHAAALTPSAAWAQ